MGNVSFYVLETRGQFNTVYLYDFENFEEYRNLLNEITNRLRKFPGEVSYEALFGLMGIALLEILIVLGYLPLS